MAVDRAPPADHPFPTLGGDAARRLLLTPHVADANRQASALLFRSAWQNVRVLVRNERPLHRVYCEGGASSCYSFNADKQFSDL
jgi:phosphoglycerate dehydrogenase-like enzyme